MSSNLDDLIDFVKEKIKIDKWTHARLSHHLQQTYPGTKGFSERSLQRFCSEKDIHKTSRVDKDDLDVVVEAAINKVCSYNY